jgi:hypothetical protein
MHLSTARTSEDRKPGPVVLSTLAVRWACRARHVTLIHLAVPAAALIGLVRATGVALLLTLAGCQPNPPPSTPPAPATSAMPAPAPRPSALPPAAAPVTSMVLPSLELPPGPMYECELTGTRTPIEYADGVEKLCRRHPEMGPCQYERDACRRRGGSVYTANGDEVTAAVEAEYDRKMRRVRFQGDAPPKR